jgi:hypothetical protein
MMLEGQTVLLVEDNNDAAELTVRAFNRAKVKKPAGPRPR